MSLAGAADTAAMALLVLVPALSKSGCCHCRPRMATPATRWAVEGHLDVGSSFSVGEWLYGGSGRGERGEKEEEKELDLEGKRKRMVWSTGNGTQA